MSEEMPDPRENRVLITVSCGTNNPNRSVRAFHLAQVAHTMGKEVAVFLLDEAVYLARKGIAENLRAPTGDVAEFNEGRLVRISGAAVGFWRNTLYLDDGSGQAAVLVLASTGTRRPYVTLGDTWTMIGIVSQRDDEPPFSDGYRLLPRGEFDLHQGPPAKADPPPVSWSASPLLLPVTGAASSP